MKGGWRKTITTDLDKDEVQHKKIIEFSYYKKKKHMESFSMDNLV